MSFCCVWLYFFDTKKPQTRGTSGFCVAFMARQSQKPEQHIDFSFFVIPNPLLLQYFSQVWDIEAGTKK